METAPFDLKRLWNAYQRFLFESIEPKLAAVFRILYSILLLLLILPWMPYVADYFGDGGRYPLAECRAILDSDTLTLFDYVPNTATVAYAVYGILLVQTVLLGFGVFSRFQAISIFFWLVSLHHRNPIIWDGEDTVMRLFAFFLALAPCGCAWSFDAWRHRRKTGHEPVVTPAHAWAIRLIQIEMCLLYLSTLFAKLNGAAWYDGTAMYYITRLDDLFGRLPFPDAIFYNLAVIKLMTWSVLAVELFIPVGVWFKQTRRWAILAAVALHLGIEWTMHLNLFEYIMILGVLSFTNSSDIVWVRGWWHALVGRFLPQRTETPQSLPLPDSPVGAG